MSLGRIAFSLLLFVAVIFGLITCRGYVAAEDISSTSDARVELTTPNTNYGSSTSLRVSNTQETYLKFDVTVAGTLDSAVLRLWATNGSVDGPAVYLVDNNWAENSINWNNKTARIGGPVADKGAIGGNTWVEFPVTTLINGTGTYSFSLVQDNVDNTNFASRESDTAKRPQLILTTTVVTPTATPTPQPTATPTPTATPPPGGGVVLIGAGDVADDGLGKFQTELLLNANPNALVFVLGDLAYDDESANKLDENYTPSWGIHRNRTFPVLGNHDMHGTPVAQHYFDYFGAAAGPVGGDKGYYTYDAGEWRVYVLNSNCDRYPQLCDPNGAQLTWLRADLAANPRQCSIAMFHHPYYTGGTLNMNPVLRNIWVDLWNANVDIVLNGHSHRYERYAPQGVDGDADNLRGIRQFTVGTGGAFFQGLGALHPNVEVRQNDTWGVLKLTLNPGNFDYEFIPVAGKTFTDSGTSIGCH